MMRDTKQRCPECARSRREFLSAVGGAAVLAAAGGPAALQARAGKRAPSPSEDLVRELFASLTAEQKRALVLPYDHASDDGTPTRRSTFDGPIDKKCIGDSYTRPQQELVQRIARSILAGDEEFERISRGGRWDSSGSFEGCGATLFGSPDRDSRFAWVFSGHHLTLRCDGDSQPGAAFGGPIYYGHGAAGYSRENVYRYQTEMVQSLFESLDERQRTRAIAPRNPGEGLGGLAPQEPRHGIAHGELSADQRAHLEKVLRTLLAPFRDEDVGEAMALVKANGGLERMNLAFYADDERPAEQPWRFWRLEGPGFVWNYRVLPHVHCFVSIGEA